MASKHLLRSLSKALKHGMGEADALKMIQQKGGKLNKAQQRTIMKRKRRKNPSAYRNYSFSPVLSTFARTEGAKDKKKRKRKTRLKILAGGALGTAGIMGAIGGRQKGRKLMEFLAKKFPNRKFLQKKVKKGGRVGAGLGALLGLGGTAGTLGTGYALGRPDKTRRDVLNEILEESANVSL